MYMYMVAVAVFGILSLREVSLQGDFLARHLSPELAEQEAQGQKFSVVEVAIFCEEIGTDQLFGEGLAQQGISRPSLPLYLAGKGRAEKGRDGVWEVSVVVGASSRCLRRRPAC